MAQTRHVYLEQTDGAGTSWPMRMAVGEDLEGIARAKKAAADASAERVHKALIAARKLEAQTGGLAVVLSNDPAYYEGWALAYNYCGAFYEYGTERLARVFAAGSDITIHSLETEASRQAALEDSRGERCRQPVHAAHRAPGLSETMELICRMMLHDVERDQREGRPASLSPAAACVLDSRHRTMAARIAEAVKRGEKPFVIVGRGHVMPDQNLTELLVAQGFALRRID